jgi:threonine/homoserine/homoserine lactone efflux protein
MTLIISINLLMQSALLSIFAAMSPGPNIIMILGSTIKYGKSYGLKMAFGVVFAVFFWLVVTSYFITDIINGNSSAKTVFMIFSAGFLYYMSYIIIKNKNTNDKIKKTKKVSFFYGFIGTILNPEVPIFYATIMSPILQNEFNSNASTMFYIGLFTAIEISWFTISVLCASKIRNFIESKSKIILQIFALLLCFFASTIIYNLFANWIITAQ